jgi:hypothetical protein
MLGFAIRIKLDFVAEIRRGGRKMSKLTVAALVALAAVSLPASPVFAQIFVGSGARGMSDRGIEGRVTEGDVYTCVAAPGGSRIRPNCDVVEEIEQLQKEMRRLQAPPPVLAQCGASTTTESQQLDTIARVKGTLEIRDCAAAAGTLTVAVVVKEKSGEEKPLEFTETWQRGDDRDVSFASDYAIGEDVELVDVHLSGLTCTCADPFAQPAPQPPAEDVQPTPEPR